MSTPAPTVVQLEAGWLTAQPGVSAACGPVLPYVRRLTGSEERQVRLRRAGSRVYTYDNGSDLIEHDMALLVSWPLEGELTGAQTYLDAAVDLLVSLLRTADRTHGGLWHDSANSGQDGVPDVTTDWNDPTDPVAMGEDGRLEATVTYTITEQRARGVA